MFSCSAPEITFSREGHRGNAKDAEGARRLRGLCASFAASASNVFFWVPRNNAFNAKDAEEARHLRGLRAFFAAAASNVFFRTEGPGSRKQPERGRSPAMAPRRRV